MLKRPNVQEADRIYFARDWSRTPVVFGPYDLQHLHRVQDLQSQFYSYLLDLQSKPTTQRITGGVLYTPSMLATNTRLITDTQKRLEQLDDAEGYFIYALLGRARASPPRRLSPVAEPVRVVRRRNHSGDLVVDVEMKEDTPRRRSSSPKSKKSRRASFQRVEDVAEWDVPTSVKRRSTAPYVFVATGQSSPRSRRRVSSPVRIQRGFQLGKR